MTSYGTRFFFRRLLLGATAADDSFTVYEGEGEGEASLGLVHVPSIESSHYLKSKFEGVPYGKRLPVTCEWNSTFERWQPII